MNDASIQFPEIGQEVNTEWGLKLCKHFGLDYLIERIRKNPGRYKPWTYDGCSGLPDRLLKAIKFLGLDWEEIEKCCLYHDLQYAYGRKGDEKERAMADGRFKVNLRIRADMPELIAEVFKKFVEALGDEALEMDFSWGFASA